jgi:hypothetical protein
VRHLPGQLNFAPETVEKLRMLEVRPEDFQCDDDTEIAVASLVDLTHTTLADNSQDPEALSDLIAGRERKLLAHGQGACHSFGLGMATAERVCRVAF